jgi:tRNA 2-thiouridine synthesizing protein A
MDLWLAVTYRKQMDWDEELDARGLLCPLPVLKARKRLQNMADGTLLMIRADDPAAVIDIPHFCSEQGHRLVLQKAGLFLVRKGIA